MTVPDRRRAFRRRLFLSFLILLAIASSRQLIASPSHGQDFRDFFAAATLVAHGGNPYDSRSLAFEQDLLYNQPGHYKPGDRAYYDSLPYPQGPWVALAIVPSTLFPWQAAYCLYLFLALLAVVAAVVALLRLFGWAPPLWQPALLAVIASPVFFINIFQGQPVPFLLAAFAGAWMLLRRGRALLAGGLLALGWIKPHIGLPVLLVACLLEPASLRRLLAGFGLGTAALFGFAELVMRGSLLHWAGAILGQWSGTLQQADLASLNAFYYPAVAGIMREALVALVVLAAVGYGAWAFRRSRAPLAKPLTVLILTFLAAPYAHSYDTLLLLPVIIALLGPTLSGWRRPSIEIALWAFATFPILYFAGFHLGYFNGFTAIPVALLAFAWHRSRYASRPSEALPAAA